MDNSLKKVWNKQSNKLFTMYINFVFGLAPGVIFITRNAFIHDEILMNQSSFRDTAFWMYMFTFLITFLYTFLQIVMKQTMALSLVRSYFAGQIVSLILILLSTSKNVVQFMKHMVNIQTDDSKMLNWLKKLVLTCILILITSIVFYIYTHSKFSELHI